MDDPRTFWLVVTNIVLGVAVVLCVIGLACGVLCEVVERLRRRRSYEKELDRDMKAFFTAGRK